MNYILPTLTAVSVMFSCLALATGAKALWSPFKFAASFGIPLDQHPDGVGNISDRRRGDTGASYVSLMGVRQLAMGITLLAFASQGKWAVVATILFILGVVVATTDGFFLYRSGEAARGSFHALPGILIALLAGAGLHFVH